MEMPAINGDTDVPAEPRQLRRPHSPSKNSSRAPPRDSPRNESLPDRDEKRERRDTKFIPPAEKQNAFQQAQQRKPPRTVQNDNRSQEAKNRSQGNQDAEQPARNQGVNRNRDELDNRPPLRRPAKMSTEPVKPAHVEPALVETKPEHATVASLGSTRDTTPRKPLVPASYVAEKIPVGATFVVAVVERATNCGSKQSGHVCLTLHDDYSGAYNRLCDEFAEQCSKDNQEYTPRIGETFAFLCAEDEGWYRARCLAPTRGALLDSGRVVSLTPRACRRLPPAYAAIPEFIAVLKMEQLKIGGNLSCTVVSCSSSAVSVSVTDEAGTALGGAEVTRWIPEVEYPAERQAPPIRQPEIKPAERQPIKEQATESHVKPTRVEPTPKNVSSRINVRNATPRKPLVPNSYVVEKLSVGDTFLAEALCLAKECGSKQSGYACLTLHEDYSDAYNQLCIEFSLECMKDSEEYTPRIGETFAFLCVEDEGWYRARCLAPTRGALLDSGRVVSLTPRACRRLPPAYAAIPEFIAVLKMEQLKIGGNLSCTVVSCSSSAVSVSVTDEAGTALGGAEVTRWIPEVEYPAEPAQVMHPVLAAPKAAAPSTAAPCTAAVPVDIPSVPRRPVEHHSLHVLLDATSLRRACVRPCDARSAAAFNAALQGTLLYGTTATPLQEPPVKGQTVVAKFIDDGTHYRALVKRVSVAKNKYLIEYIEYGNEEIVPLERLYPCPAKLTLDAAPAQASIVRLSDREPATLTAAATAYIDSLKDNATELILTVPGGDRTAASGSLVQLLIAKNCESVTKRIEELCTPEWKKLLEKGGDVLETETRFFPHLNYCSVPTSRPFVLRVTFCDIQTLARGAVCGYEKGDETADLVYGELADQIAEYCASPLCRDPYLPKPEELCISKNKRLNKWVRSVLVAQPDGPGSQVGSVMHIDYGDLEDVSTADIRKMLPEFVDKYPALAQDFDIRGFPVGKVSRAQLERGLELMKVTAEGVGELHVRSCRELDDKMFELDAPELIAAITQ